LGEKPLDNEGEFTPITVIVALAGEVFVIVPPPPVPVKPPVGMVLMRLPGMDDVTSMETLHEPGDKPTCGGTFPPLNVSVVSPAVATTVPPQVLVKFTGFAIVRPG
jgi:hypothetical protein